MCYAALIQLHFKWDNVDIGDGTEGQKEEDLAIPVFDFVTVATTTGIFSRNNKLGEGGFGPVYKVTDNECYPKE